MLEINAFMTVNDVAQLLKVWPQTVRIWLRDRKLKGIKLPGGEWRITPESVQEMLQGDERLNRPIEVGD